jgi:hypothetical protein
MKRISFALFFVTIVPFVYCIEGSRIDTDTLTEEIAEDIETDANKDGRIDYRLSLDTGAQKVEEVLDTNGDGDMDDFSFYRRGVLYMRELDTNFDGIIDIWVFIREGVYVERYERDKDFDGKIDVSKDFGK